MNIYLTAWNLLLERLEGKTSWGKEEVKKLALRCLLDAGIEQLQQKGPPPNTTSCHV